MARLSIIFTTILCGAALAPMGRAQDSQNPPPAGPSQQVSSSEKQTPAGGQTTSANSKAAKNVAPGRRFFYGARVFLFPLRQFDTSSRQTETANPLADYTYSATSSSQKEALAATFEYVITPRLSAGVEFYLTHAKYVLTTDVRTGLPSPNSSVDDRPVTTYTQTNNADYWVLPVVARYQAIRTGKLSHFYLVGGAEYRYVGRVRTGTDINYPDGTTGYNEIPTVPNHRNQIGVVAGFGVRFFDQFGFKLMPEVRYVRWNNSAFQGPGYASTKNQAEASLGFSF